MNGGVPRSADHLDEVSDDDDVSRIADDINGLAVSLDSLNSYNASYLGFSSVPTILRAIAHLSPRIRQVVPPSPETWKTTVPAGGSPESNTSCDVDELTLINAYFLHVHPITPTIDEVDFRQRFADGKVPETHKTSWLSLYSIWCLLWAALPQIICSSASTISFTNAL